MATDRDLAVAVVRAARSMGTLLASGWEMTSATGVRGLRIVTEAGPFERFVLTESHPEAAAVLRRNAAGRPEVVVREGDARVVIESDRFDYVDLDPYGSPVPFVPAAIASVRPGGLLAVTATDMMVLAGAQPAACLRRYGAVPVRGRLGPEGGLRILLAYLAREARRAGRGVRPLLAYVRDHHVRAYLSVRAEPPGTEPVGLLDPARWNGPPLGERGPYGPFWLGPLFSSALVGALRAPPGLERPTEVAAWIGRMREECEVDVPFYFEANSLAGALHLVAPPSLSRLFEELRNRGYRAVRSHARPAAFRTDAPRSVVEQAARALGSG